jgi:hypothetical protein
MAHVLIANGNTYEVVRNLLNEVGSKTDDIYDEMIQHKVSIKSCSSITTTNLFTITGGPIFLIDILGQITTGIAAGANNTKIVYTPTGGSAVDLCAVLNVASSAIRKVLSITGVKADALKLSADEGVVVRPFSTHARLILMPGVIQMNCAATTTGVVDWSLLYEPILLTSAVAVV